jgi:hypothetical protein
MLWKKKQNFLLQGEEDGMMQLEETVFFSRLLTELTLSFHIIYATIGVGIPLMIMIAQWIDIKNRMITTFF